RLGDGADIDVGIGGVAGGAVASTVQLKLDQLTLYPDLGHERRLARLNRDAVLLEALGVLGIVYRGRRARIHIDARLGGRQGQLRDDGLALEVGAERRFVLRRELRG